MTNPDYELVRRTLEGDETAFEELVRANQKMVYSLALRMLRYPDRAQDAAQEAFIKAYRNLASFRNDGKFSTWIYRITYNVAIDRIRKNREEIPVEDWDAADDRATPEDALVQAESAQLIREAVENITPEYRRALELFYFSGRKYNEAAEIMGIPLNTFKTYIYRGKRELLSAAQKTGLCVTP
jgi:RNA polymerase sigma-70 factor (ECF subfamily)